MKLDLTTSHIADASILTDTYNSLPTIEQAASSITDHAFISVLDNLGYLILSNNLENYIGLRLLHKHNNLCERELMIEKEDLSADDRPSLSTAPLIPSHNLDSFYPSIWQLVADEFLPLEYTTDPIVADVQHRFDSEFTSGFTTLLNRSGLQKLIGPCAIKRQFYTKYRPVKSALLIEVTDPQKRANIVTFTDTQDLPVSKLVPTTWEIKRSFDTVTACEIQNCQTVTACVVDSTGHSSQSTHTSQQVFVPDPSAPPTPVPC